MWDRLDMLANIAPVAELDPFRAGRHTPPVIDDRHPGEEEEDFDEEIDDDDDLDDDLEDDDDDLDDEEDDLEDEDFDEDSRR